MSTSLKFGLASAVVVGTLGWLAVGGINQSSAYYKEIPELQKMGDRAQQKRLRVNGYVLPGSIVREDHNVRFVLVEHEGAANEGMHLPVVYVGADTLPDTFKEHSQALADGKLDASGVFQATHIQAKCASKYEATAPTSVKLAGASSI